MPAEVFEMESFCDHCGKNTPHLIENAGHERDSSWDREECLVCHWWNLGLSGTQLPPREESP